jgi:hypothetical protein
LKIDCNANAPAAARPAAAAVQRDNPNTLDRFNADWKAAHPEATTIGPVMSPNLLELLKKKEREPKP